MLLFRNASIHDNEKEREEIKEGEATESKLIVYQQIREDCVRA